MAEIESWTCPVCARHATIGEHDRAHRFLDLHCATGRIDNESFRVFGALRRCPHPECKSNVLSVSVRRAAYTEFRGTSHIDVNNSAEGLLGRHQFLPRTAQPLSAEVPDGVKEDYQEAYLIRELSPKASATLARRALQGMVRDFWGFSKYTLAQELEAIKDKCDADLYQALMDVKSIGNIGAHPDRDISLIIEIEPGEAVQLLDLIHLLDQEWYVARVTKRLRLEKVRSLAQSKADGQ